VYQQGITNAAQSLHVEAVANFLAAAQLSPRCAELHFRLGQSLLAITNLESAYQSFAEARDLDTLPFRADATLNRIILETVTRHGGKTVSCVDAEKALAPLSPSHIPGREAFYEHVHLNPDGNYWLARALAEEVLLRLPAGFANRQTSAWAAPDTCAQALGLTDWNRFTILEEVGHRLAEAPFANRFDNALRREELRAQMTPLKLRMSRPAAQKAQAGFEAALQDRPGDHWLHHNYAEFLTAIGNLPLATTQMEKVRDLLPHHHAAYFQLGRLLARQGKYDQARQSLQTAIRFRPDVAEVYIELGQVDAAQGKLDEALAQFAAAQRLHEDDARVCFLRADVLERQNRRGEAIRNLREAIRLRPTYWEAYDRLGVVLGLEGNFAEAQAAFLAVVHFRSEDPDAHLNLGIALARQQKLDEAIAQFQKTLELDPRNQRAIEFIQAIRKARQP
jgi:tetratricopeptide (TPR) repeat protein